MLGRNRRLTTLSMIDVGGLENSYKVTQGVVLNNNTLMFLFLGNRKYEKYCAKFTVWRHRFYSQMTGDLVKKDFAAITAKILEHDWFMEY